MDYSLTKSRKKNSRWDSNPNQLGATRMNDSNDYGFDWLGDDQYDWESSRKEEMRMSKREIPNDWNAFGATSRDRYGNPVRDNVGRTLNEPCDAMRRVDLGATGETRREDFPYGPRASYGRSRTDYAEQGPYHLGLQGTAGPSRTEPLEPVREEISRPSNELYNYTIADGLEGADGKPRLWTSVAADKSLMGRWHAMFGQIRTKWAPSSGIDGAIAVSKYSDGQSFSDEQSLDDPRGRFQRRIIIGLAIGVILLLAVVVPTVVLTMGKDEQGEFLKYEYEARITNRNYSEDMADSSSEAFTNVADEFCDQVDQDASKSNTEFTYRGCAVSEIKNGSLLIIYQLVIFLSPSSAQPTAAEVSLAVGIKIEDVEQDIGNFSISITIAVGTPVVIEEEDTPVRKKVEFNETCRVAKNDRCLTRKSECIAGVCSCPVDRYYANTTNKCSKIDCGADPTVGNGIVTSSGTIYGATLNITCDHGFELSHNATVICTTEGSWGILPSCEQAVCPEFIKPEYSNIVSWNESTSTSELDCVEGYFIVGNTTVTCSADGKWSISPTCEPKDCGPPNEIPHAVLIDFNDTTFNSNFYIECSEGFVSPNNLTVTCQSNGTWSELPTCELVSCGNFTVPDHTKVTMEEGNTYGKLVKFECEEGYDMIGQSEIRCQKNSTWTAYPVCEIKDCGTIGDIQDGAVLNRTGTVVDSVLFIKCNDGFDIIGNNNVTCLATGNWNTLPICRKTECGNYIPPEHTNIGQNYTITCDNGYELTDNVSLECVNGNWSKFDGCEPVHCDTFPDIENANMSKKDGETYIFGDTLDISCNDGFEISGISKTTCGANKTWENVPTCSKITCRDFQIPSNADVGNQNTTNRVFGDVIKVNCSEGYNLTGNGSSICGADPTVGNGIVTSSGTIYGATLNITCDHGFELSHNATVICTTEGSWGILPSCEQVVCPEFIKPEYSNIVSWNESTSTSELDCVEGYFIVGNTTVTCSADGKWSISPTCEPKDCGPPNEIPHAVLIDFNDTTFNSNFYIECSEGFVSPNNLTVTCQSNGTWSELPTCELVSCGNFTVPDHTKVTMEEGNTYGKLVKFECEEGYDMIGQSEIRCQKNSTWTAYPVCEIKDCGTIGDIQDGAVLNRTGTVVDSVLFIKCNDGFDIIGNNNVTCLATGNWNTLPICRKTECGNYIPPEHTNIGQNYTITCDNGYELTDNVSLECVNGNWSKFDGCEPVHCDTFPDIENANMSKKDGETYIFGDTLDISCNDGFEISGISKTTCGANKTWENVPTCSKITCRDFQIPSNADVGNQNTTNRVFGDVIKVNCSEGYNLTGNGSSICGADPTVGNGIVTSSGTIYGATLNITCDHGFELSHNATVICTTEGSWGILPSCEQVVCPEFIKPEYSNIVSWNESTSTSELDCVEGYFIVGNTTVTCSADGKWSISPTCEPKDCGPPNEIPHAVLIDFNDTTFNSNFYIECSEGFVSPNNLTVTCQSNGTWSELPTCELVSCGNFTVPDHTKVTMEEGNTYGKLVKFECEEGYDMIGQSEIRCQKNSTWTAYPVCEIKDCGTIGDIQDGAVLNRTGTVVDSVLFIKCNDGFDIIGNNNVTCLATGNWNTLPICRKTECGNYFPPEHTNIGQNYTITCDNGYELTDNVSLECVNGNWSKFDGCEPVHCDTFPDIENANMSKKDGETYIFGDTLDISCNDGFEISGISKTTCGANKTWENVPTCSKITCRDFQIPSNADVGNQNTTNRVFGDVIKVNCSEGYNLTGNGSSICGADRQWLNIPICDAIICEELSVSPHGTIVSEKEQYLFNDKVNVSCIPGYILQGNEQIHCQTDGRWIDLPECYPRNCVKFNVPENATISPSKSNYTYNETISVKCDIGFMLEGNDTLSCDENGTWMGMSKCTTLICDKLEIADAEIIPNKTDYVYNENVTVKCDSGFMIEGNGTLSCDENGTWTGIPKCTPIICDKLEIADAEIIPNKTDYVYNENVTVKCDSGFKLEGNGTLSCDENGTWMGMPKCTPLICDKLEIADAEIIPNKTDYVYNENVTVKCDSGFELEGNGTLSCDENGTWMGMSKCTPLICDKLEIADAEIIPNKTDYVYNENVTVKCDSGFKLEGNGTLSCDENGTWMGMPKCTPLICDKLEIADAEIIPNKTDYVYNENVTVKCDSGFKLEGNGTLSCDENGTWMGMPKCTPLICDKLEIADAEIIPNKTDYVYNENVTVKCDSGFKLEGNGTLSCDENGTWMGMPKCTPIICDKLEIADAEIIPNKTDYVYNENVTVKCDSGFKLEGNGTLSCDENGTWMGMPKCTPLICDKLEIADAEIIPNKTNIVYNENVTVKCDSGFKLEGNGTLSCDENGTWMGMPKCTPIICDKLEIADAEIIPNKTNIVYNENVTVKCDSGFKLEGNGTLSCDENGTWMGMPKCTPLICDKLEIADAEIIPNKTDYVYNENVTVKCDSGFELEGNGTLSCDENGTWMGMSKCTPLICDKLEIADAEIIPNKTDYVYNENVTVKCDSGFELEGNGTLSCDENGTWMGMSKCTPLICDKLEIADAEIIPNKTDYVYNENVTVKCDSGFKLEGNGTLSCDENGTWMGMPKCTPLICDKLEIADAEIIPNKTDYVYNENVTVKCDSGFKLEGNGTLSCDENGTWIGMPKCTPLICDKLEIADAEIIPNKTDYVYNENVTVKCDSGFELEGNGTLSCDENGTWMNIPKCTDVQINCSTDDLLQPENSKVSEVNESTSSVEIECMDGYFIVGNASVSCIAGNWTEIPACELVDCGDYVPAINNHFADSDIVTTYNSSANVKCIGGLQLTNESAKVITCGADGTWDGNPICIIAGEVSFTKNSYSFDEGGNETVVCNVTAYPNWQTVMVGKLDIMNGSSVTPVFRIFKENGSILNDTFGTHYGISVMSDEDGVSISLNLNPVKCEDEGIYTCAAIVGNFTNPIETKTTNTNVSVTCSSGCREYKPSTDTHFVNTSGTTPQNTSLSVSCIDGLVFSNESTTEVTCGADGQWQGEPECIIPGEVSFTENSYFFIDGNTETVVCNVTAYPKWQTVMVGKINTMNASSLTPVFRLFKGNGSILNDTFGTHYIVSVMSEADGVSISLNLNPVKCEDGGIYTCAAIVGNVTNPIETKSTNTNVNVSCSIVCGEYKPSAETHFVNTSGTTPQNTSLSVTCIDGLVFSNESTTEVTCGADGQWQGEPECIIPGEVSFTENSYFFIDGNTETVVCNVTAYPKWQTVMVGKINTMNASSLTPVFRLFKGNGSILNDTFGTHYIVSVMSEADGVSISLNLNPVKCEDGGIYTCAAIVGNVTNPIETKSTNTNVNVSCSIVCGEYKPSAETHFVNTSGKTPQNTSLSVTCIDGLVFSNESTTEVTCGADGQWQGEPECIIPGEVSFTENSYFFIDGNTETVVCNVTAYPKWQTVMVGKINTMNASSLTPVFRLFKGNGSILNDTFGTHYIVSVMSEADGVSISLNLNPVKCEDGGIYTCAAIVGNVTNPIETKSTNTNVNVSCSIVCGEYKPSAETHFVNTSGKTPQNTSLSVTCIDGLVFSNESTTEVTCGADGQWQGEPECIIPGEVSFTENSYFFIDGNTETVVCNVTAYPKWQTVMVGKINTMNASSLTPVFRLFKGNGSILNDTFGTHYIVSVMSEADGVSISLNLNPVKCEDEGIYTCAAIVGNVTNPIETKSTNTNVNVSCSIVCGEYKPSAETHFVNTSGTTPQNTSLSVTCIDGLVFSNESTTEVTCGADGQWQGDPECVIPGNVTFTHPSYSFDYGETKMINCEVSDYPGWQTILVGKANNQDNTPLALVFKGNGTVVIDNMSNGTYTFNATSKENGVTVAIISSSSTCDIEGILSCAAVVGDPQNAVDIKLTSTHVTVTSESSIPEINVPDTVYSGREAEVQCIGRIGKGSSGDSIGKLFMLSNFGENMSTLLYNGSDTPEKDGCYFTDAITASIPTHSGASALWAKCVIRHSNSTDLESEQKNISIKSSFVAFENSTYLFNIGEKATFSCDVENIPGWNRIEIRSEEGIVIVVNGSELRAETSDAHVSLIENERFFTNSSGRVAVLFDPVQCNDTFKGVAGDVEYTCAVVTGNGTIEAKTLVTFQRPPSVPELTLSFQIIEGQDTWADRLFECKGELGDPPGHFEVESDFNGDFNTFLSPFANETSHGVIVSETVTNSSCGNYQTIKFALKNISKNYMHLKNLRCATKPSAHLVNGKVMYSEQKVIKVVPENYCEGSSVAYLAHPYYCNMALICGNGTVNGVPIPLCDIDKCADATSGTTYLCTACDSVVGGCESKGVQCDRTKVASHIGNVVSYTCNTQDFGKVSHISVNALVDVDVNDVGESIEVMKNVNITVSQYYVLLSFANVSCGQEGNYMIRLNNETDITLSLGIISDPEKPALSLPLTLTANQETKVNCSGKVGRDEDRKNKTAVYLDVKFQDSDMFEVYRGDETRQSVDDNCEISETVMFSITPYVGWNNSDVRCISRNETDVVDYSASEIIILQVPALFCQPVLQISEIGGSVIFMCAMKDIPENASVNVSKNGTELINADVKNLPIVQEISSNFILTVPSVEELHMNISDVKCEQEGMYQVTVNDGLSATVSLRIISPVLEPSLNKPSEGRVNEEFEMNCSCDTGRDAEGNAASNLYLEIKLANESEYSVYKDVTRDPAVLNNCQYKETVRLTFFPDASWNNSKVRCVARNESDIITSTTEQDILLNGPNTYFESTELTGVVGESLILTCVVDNMKDLSNIVISKVANRTTIASYSHSSNSDGVIVITEGSFINGSTGVLKINMSVQCNDDGIYHCKPTGSGPTSEAVTSLHLQRKPSAPALIMSREIIENKFTLGDRLFYCQGDVGDPAGTIEIQSNFNGSFETFLSPEPGLGNNSVAWIVSDEADVSSCRNFRTISFAFENITMEMQSKRLRCVIHPAKNLSSSLEYTYDEKSINVIPATYCIGKTGYTSHPYFCHLLVVCDSTTDGVNHGVPVGCDEDMCYDDFDNCVNCSTIGGCNITGPTNTTSTTTTTPSPDLPHLTSEDLLTGRYGENTELTCSFNNITIDFSNLTDSPVIVTVDSSSSPIFNSSRDSLHDSNSFVTSNGVKITLTANSVVLTFASLQCQHIGTYTFKYLALETSSQVDITATVTTPTISKEPDKFYRNQIVNLTCTGDVGRPKGDLALQVLVNTSGDNNWQEVAEITQTESETSNCTTVITVSHVFYVDENMDGRQYRCESKGEDGGALNSGIERVEISGPVVSFTETAVVVEIGSSLEVKCVLDGTTASNGVVISRNSVQIGEEHLCNVSNTGSVTCGSSGITGAASVNESSMTATVTIDSVDCEDEGTFYCEPATSSFLQSSMTLSITKPPAGAPMLTLPIRMVVGVKEYSDKITCSANVGYPAGDLRIEYSNDNFTTYDTFNLGTADLTIEEKDGCSINKTTAFKEYTYTESWNNTDVRCAVYHPAGAQDPAKVSDIQTVRVINNICTTTNGSYLYHTLNCHYFVYCNSNTPTIIACTGNTCPDIQDNAIQPHCTNSCPSPDC